MQKYIYILLLFLFTSQAQSHTSNYKHISKIEMEILRNDKVIGYSNYFFEHEDNKMTVKNYTQFKVKLLGVTIFSISSEAIEKYEDDKLVFFKSYTFQNNKEKFVNLKYDKNLNKFIIDGSSFKGKADIDNVIGNWWNNKILTANRQISPLSGSIKEQTVNLLKKEMIKLYGKSYEVLHYKLKSKNANLPKDKKLNFDIWLDPQKSLIVKIAYERMGKWEYRLKNFE
tara:strand:- start:966 stop:1646 length:681 start_codon:yes stop_codon:yes gene_type:complete